MNFSNLIKLQAASSAPVYKQLSDQLIDNIKSGEIISCTKLPSERDLAEELGLSRGTVKKAYERLIQARFAVTVRGKGTYVSDFYSPDSSSRLKLAEEAIAELISKLEEFGFSHKEISNLFSSHIAQREEICAAFTIAAVDCNPEALEVYQKQISLLNQLNVSRFELEDLKLERQPEKILEAFDLIVTTTNHYSELKQLAPGLGDKLVQVGVAPSTETMVELGQLGESSSAGILYYSDKFCEIVRGWISKFYPSKKCRSFQIGAGKDFSEFLHGCSTLVVPQTFLKGAPSELMRLLQEYRLSGGRLLHFQYQIEPGSLVNLESLIKRLLNNLR